MAVKMRILCPRCHNSWEIYQTSNWNSNTANHCPMCFKTIDRQTWDKFIVPAFGGAIDADCELKRTEQRFKFRIING